MQPYRASCGRGSAGGEGGNLKGGEGGHVPRLEAGVGRWGTCMLLFMLRSGFDHTEPWSNIRLYWEGGVRSVRSLHSPCVVADLHCSWCWCRCCYLLVLLLGFQWLRPPLLLDACCRGRSHARMVQLLSAAAGRAGKVFGDLQEPTQRRFVLFVGKRIAATADIVLAALYN